MAMRESDIGKFTLQKGNVKGISVFSLDCVSLCSKEQCPISNVCSYEQKGYCSFEQRWIKAAFNPYLELLNRIPSKFLAQIIGMQIMPLFRHLIILHKQQMAMKESEILQSDKKSGQQKISPIFDEIRKTTIAIMTVMKSTGVLVLAEQAGLMDVLSSGPPKPEPTGNFDDDESFNLTYGDPGHLGAISGDVE
jgi:hypothetical protein